MPKFEGYERRIAQINKVLEENGFTSLEEVQDMLMGKGIDVGAIVRGIQPIAFENAERWINSQIKKGLLADPKIFTGLYFAQKYIEGKLN